MILINGVITLLVSVWLAKKYPGHAGWFNLAMFIGYVGLVLILMGLTS